MADCPTCGRDDFASEQGMKTHHKRVHGESLAGEVYICENCGKEFERYDASHEYRYCSTSCFALDNNQLEDHPRWGEAEVADCEVCGSSFRRSDSRIRTCGSSECKSEMRSRVTSGEDNPRWKGGKTVEYGSNWEQARKKVVERDQEVCQNCGKSVDESFVESLPVHHLTPIAEFEDPEDANKLSNLVQLCFVCHPTFEVLPADEQRRRLGLV